MNFKALFALSALSLALASSDAAINPGGGAWTNVTVVSMTACTAARCPPHGWVTAQLSANASGSPPACASEHRDSVAVDDSEGKGGGMALMLLNMSMLTAEPISIAGTGACSVDAVIETAGTVTSSHQASRATLRTGPPQQ